MNKMLLIAIVLLLSGCAATSTPQDRSSMYGVETHAVDRAMFVEGEGQK